MLLHLVIVFVISSFSAFGAEKVVFACNHFPPLKIEKSPEKPGSDVEILREVFKDMNINFSYKFLPWKRALMLASNGEFDGLCSCSYTKKREEKFYYSDMIAESSIGIFTKSKKVKISNIGDLKGLTVGVVRGYNLESELKKRKIKSLGLSSDFNLIQVLNRNRVDVIYSYKSPIKYILKDKKYKNEFFYHELRVSPYFTCFSKTRKDSENLLNRFNKSLKEIKEKGTYQKILTKYAINE